MCIVGCFAHGNVSAQGSDAALSISSFPLSAALTCSRLTHALYSPHSKNTHTLDALPAKKDRQTHTHPHTNADESPRLSCRCWGVNDSPGGF